MTELNIELQHIQKSYSRPVLTDINLSISNGSYITIIGKSGSGKSTLLNILGLIESFDGGRYSFNGKRIHNYADHSSLRLSSIGFIFQSYNLIPSLTCKENILLPTLYRHSQQPRLFDELVDSLDLAPLLSQSVTTLSGGEKQRVAIARSLMLDPALILADEPTGNLDPKNTARIMELLGNENAKGRAVVLITHDMNNTIGSKEIYQLENGQLAEMKSSLLLGNDQ